MAVKTRIIRHLRRKQSGTQYRTIWQVLHLDITLLVLIVLLNIAGFFILYSASNQQTSIILSQSVHLIMAVIIMLALAQIPPWVYERWTPWFYGISLTLLVAVLIVGHITLGAQRWINLGIIRFQPSDLMRIAIPMMLAWFFSNRNLPPNYRSLGIALFIIFIPAIITAKEPDLGSAIIMIMAGACVLLFAGISWR